MVSEKNRVEEDRLMTKIERYAEFLVNVSHPWEAVCYWCGKIFHKRYNRGTANGWREHINIEHETKIFCSKKCKAEWIDYKQTFGELVP